MVVTRVRPRILPARIRNWQLAGGQPTAHGQVEVNGHRVQALQYVRCLKLLAFQRTFVQSSLLPLIGIGPWDTNDDLTDLVALSMGSRGLPMRLFLTNRRVTGGIGSGAEGVSYLVDALVID